MKDRYYDDAVRLSSPPPPPREPQTHDYTKRGWGHDYTFSPIDAGQCGRMSGWGRGIEAGDYLLLDNQGSSSRYRVDRIEYQMNPRDMWFADVTFAPRERPPS